MLILQTGKLIAKDYKQHDQSVGSGAESIIDFAYVLLRMLERYSKTKAFMFVRKRKAARRKRKAGGATGASGPSAEEYAGDDEEGEDGGAEKETPSYAEHTFTFQTFEKVSQMSPSIDRVKADVRLSALQTRPLSTPCSHTWVDIGHSTIRIR